jgi:outer membrane protein OmpA-like peptidoglycan-associated protein
MRKAAAFAAALLLFSACSRPLKPEEKEEARRAQLELQSALDMVTSKQVPPIEFEPGSAKLMDSSFGLLDKVAEVLIHHNNLKLLVFGHTDSNGSKADNDLLSLKRASSVKQYLASKGVQPDSVRIFGYGSRRPLMKETTDKARALNRRVEFRITTRDWGTIY